MKRIFLFSLFIGLSLQLFAQKSNVQTIKGVDTLSFEVAGVCGMCKTRIENAALIKGVKKADWNKTTKILALVYDVKKTTIDDVHTSIAKSGHDTPIKKGDDKAYAKLPPCCKYRDKKVTTH